eukprot:scaffold1250_cov106-Isochrysis_galbana.AAC.2
MARLDSVASSECQASWRSRSPASSPSADVAQSSRGQTQARAAWSSRQRGSGKARRIEGSSGMSACRSRSEKRSYGRRSAKAGSTDVFETGSSWMMSGTHPCATDSYTRVEKPMPEGARQNLDCCSTAKYSDGPSCARAPALASPRRSRSMNPSVELYRE